MSLNNFFIFSILRHLQDIVVILEKLFKLIYIKKLVFTWSVCVYQNQSHYCFPTTTTTIGLLQAMGIIVVYSQGRGHQSLLIIRRDIVLFMKYI